MLLSTSLMFHCRHDGSSLEHEIEKTFAHFDGISLNSQTYVSTIKNENFELFEVFRKISGDLLTVTSLYQHNRSDQFSYIWERRSNLTGVQFKIAVAPQSTLVRDNQVVSLP